MSSSAATPTVIPSPDRLPPEVGSTLTAVWLSVGFGLVALLAFWPMAIAGAPAVFEVKDRDNLANLGWMALGATVVCILLVGLAVSFLVGRKKKSGLRFLRLSMLGGMVVGLAIVGGIVFLTMQAKGEAPLGPAPILSGMMLFLAALLPFGFAIFALSYAGTDQVEAYFRPEAPPEEESYASVGLAPGMATGEAVGEVSEAAIEEPAHGGVGMPDPAFDERLVQEREFAAGQLGPADKTSATHVVIHGQETMVPPEEGSVGARSTMLAPASEALDEIFSEEIAKEAEAAPAASGSSSGEPISPESLDAIFSEEEASAPSLVPGGADPDVPGTFSDSIFDEDDLPSEHLDHGQGRMLPNLIPGPDSKATGESSIFSESNPMVPGSGVISGMVSEPASPEIVMPESGQGMPSGSKPKTMPPARKPDDTEETTSAE